MKHLEVTLFQFLAILYLVTYDAFNVSLVESLFYDEMQKNKEHIICFQQNILLRWHTWETCFSLSKHPCKIFLHRVGSSWVTPDDPAKQWFSALSKSGWSGPTPDDLDPDRSDRSNRLVWPVWPRVVHLSILKWEMMLWIIIWRTLSLKAQVWVHKSDSKCC